jgi:hypothetical protein
MSPDIKETESRKFFRRSSTKSIPYSEEQHWSDSKRRNRWLSECSAVHGGCGINEKTVLWRKWPHLLPRAIQTSLESMNPGENLPLLQIEKRDSDIRRTLSCMIHKKHFPTQNQFLSRCQIKISSNFVRLFWMKLSICE